jgi:flagellar motor switch protein FliN
MSETVDTEMTVPAEPADAFVEGEVQFEALEPPVTAVTSDGTDLSRVIDVPVELAVEIGRTTMTIGETLSLAPGSIVSLNRLAGEPVDLLVNGKVIAQGEVVVIDEEFGMRITDIVSAHQRLADASSPEE